MTAVETPGKNGKQKHTPSGKFKGGPAHKKFDPASMPASRAREIESSWWDIHTTAEFLGVTRRQVDRWLESGRLPPECTEMVNGVRFFDPALVTAYRGETKPTGQEIVRPAMADPAQQAMAMYWRSAADMSRVNNAAVAENQSFIHAMLGTYVENFGPTLTAMRGEITRLQEENNRLREKVWAGFEAIEEAKDRSNERDIAALSATRREARFADTFDMFRELAPRLVEQFVGIREVKKQIGKLDEKTLVVMLQAVQDENLRALLKKIHEEEQARVVRLQDLAAGKKTGPASSSATSAEKAEGAA